MKYVQFFISKKCVRVDVTMNCSFIVIVIVIRSEYLSQFRPRILTRSTLPQAESRKLKKSKYLLAFLIEKWENAGLSMEVGWDSVMAGHFPSLTSSQRWNQITRFSTIRHPSPLVLKYEFIKIKIKIIRSARRTCQY